MRHWSLLKKRLSELDLRPGLRSLAESLIAGRTISEIAESRVCTERDVRLGAALLLHYLSRLPPEGPDPAGIPLRPGPRPLAPGHAADRRRGASERADSGGYLR
jgi:hypothetical protein